MHKEEFLAGLPFKMADTMDLQPVYSYVNVAGLQCIQMYSAANPNPVFHCKVIEVIDTRIKVRFEVLGQDMHITVTFQEMFLVGDGLPLKTYTVDCIQACIHKHPEGFKVLIADLYSGSKLSHLTRVWPTLTGADTYARKAINHK